MHMPAPLKLAAAGAALLAGTGLGLPAAASAAAQPAWSAARPGASPATGFFQEYPGFNLTGAGSETRCRRNVVVRGGLGTVRSVRNDCGVQVFLLYPASAHRHPDCISPRAARNITDPPFQRTDGAGVRFGTSAARC